MGKDANQFSLSSSLTRSVSRQSRSQASALSRPPVSLTIERADQGASSAHAFPIDNTFWLLQRIARRCVRAGVRRAMKSLSLVRVQVAPAGDLEPGELLARAVGRAQRISLSPGLNLEFT